MCIVLIPEGQRGVVFLVSSSWFAQPACFPDTLPWGSTVFHELGATTLIINQENALQTYQ